MIRSISEMRPVFDVSTYWQPVKVTFWTQATGDYTREFKSLPKIAGYADDPETFYDKLVTDALSCDPPVS